MNTNELSLTFLQGAYNDAYTLYHDHLILLVTLGGIIIAFTGIVIPIVLSIIQNRNLKNEREIMRQSLKDERELMRNENRSLRIELKAMKSRINVRELEITQLATTIQSQGVVVLKTSGMSYVESARIGIIIGYPKGHIWCCYIFALGQFAFSSELYQTFKIYYDILWRFSPVIPEDLLLNNESIRDMIRIINNILHEQHIVEERPQFQIWLNQLIEALRNNSTSPSTEDPR